jgi:predicted methyltransferase
MIVLSHIQVAPLLVVKDDPTVKVSLDLNLTSSSCELSADGLSTPAGLVALTDLKKIAKDENGCFLVENGQITKIQAYSEEFARFYSLYPTANAPTMRVAGFPMHRIKDTDPWADTQEKIKAVGPVKGEVLDTTTGLGYTAILAAKQAKHVTTIEIDPVATEICHYNPWSQALFAPRITQLYGDSFEVLDALPAAKFEAIIHDPPTRQLAGDLYSEEFYAKLLAVLQPRGRLYHYIGDPDSHFGASVTEGVIRRLRLAGFKKVIRHPAAFGVVATL